MRLLTAVRIAHSLGAPVEALLDGIYWDPGEIASTVALRRPDAERLAGFFLVLPPGVPAFERAASGEVVRSRAEATAALGAKVREARERRHLTQAELARASGLGREGISLIERGITETTLGVVLALARSLAVPPDYLLARIAWRPERAPSPRAGGGGAQGHAPGSLDAAVARLWEEGRSAPEIAPALDASVGSISASSRASDQDVAARIGADLACLRGRAGLALRQLGEAAECDRSHVHRVESGRRLLTLPFLAKLAAGLNVRPDLLVSGITWEVDTGTFRVSEVPIEEADPRERLGENARRVRRTICASQREVAERALISRGDVVDFEHGKRNFRIFTATRLAGALGAELGDLLTGVIDWYVRPLPPPELAPGECRPTKAESDALLVRLWCEGRPEKEIAEALGLSVAAVGPYVRELRDAGRRLPYRRPPRSRAEVAARLRRARPSELPAG